MTDDITNLRSLVEKSADADFLREMIGFAAEKLMALDVGMKTGVGYGEKFSSVKWTRHAVENSTQKANEN